MKNVPNNLRDLKNKVNKLDVDNLLPILIDLSKLSDIVKIDVVKKDAYDVNAILLLLMLK